MRGGSGLTEAPEDFTAAEKEKLRSWLLERPDRAALEKDMDDLLEEMLDYWRARDGRFKDWSAAARNWLRKSVSFRPEATVMTRPTSFFDQASRTKANIASAVTLLRGGRDERR